jgi:hypothetical protein
LLADPFCSIFKGYWPAYSTEPARSPHAVWDEIGEAVIRELDYSHVILKLNTRVNLSFFPPPMCIG